MTPGETPQQGAEEPVKDVKPRRVANAMLVLVRLAQLLYWLIRLNSV